ncbi:DNA-binding transcriptional dual regulator, leucine-binding (modular protein) [Mesorhizobium plurifarium]|uniref:DNA-binding transcriptional dual regulator, leucine-binding (Modular protein) n=3 Tax=Mesorhizobium TaxID=68287 RepID=A0A090GI21_MESPL|nr:DNA-binding transcriptional dual regulator, leucine-binding (modular protein) [Mesorhizobium plurifarium]
MHVAQRYVRRWITPCIKTRRKSSQSYGLQRETKLQNRERFLRESLFMPLKADLDAIDWKILRELQGDGRMTNVELSNRVGISAPPCLRRVRRLEEAGIIRGYRALLNAPALGMDVVAFCLIGLHHQADAELKTFAERTRGWPIVRDAWMVSGESDFLLHCVASDLGTFQTFVIEELASAPNVDTVRTALTIRRVKDEGLVAFPT